MCLFLDVNFNTSTWTFILVSVSLGTVLLGFYGLYMDIRNDIHEEKCKSEKLRCLDAALRELKKDVCLLKKGVQESEKEVKAVQGEMKLLKTDKTGLVDFAYKGEVISTGNTETFESEATESTGFVLCGQPHLERRILESSVMPGDCWPIRGQEGTAVIALTNDVLVTKVTLEHASRALLPHNATLATPKLFSLWGLPEGGDDPDKSGGNHFFGQFEYSLANPEVQSFFVVHPSNNTFRHVEFKVHSNHGHPDYTCVYRVRVHGRLL